MQKSFRTSTAALAVGLVLASCGSSAGTDADAVTVAPTETAAASTLPDEADNETATGDTPVANTTGESANSAPAATDASSQTASTDAPAAPAAAPAEAVLGGRAFASDLGAESDFDANVFPDLQVDDIRAAAKVNLRNVFPADRPVLVWLWAPH